MHLRKISVIGFKNIGQAALGFSPGVNCFVGDNGAGKTNLVDAIHYLAMCKSSLAMTDGQSLRHGDEFFLVDGEFADARERKECVVCAFKKGAGKSVKRNGKEYEKLSDHIGLIPLVIVSPADSFLVTDSADERRRYLNSFLSQLDREYLAALIRYNRVLGERNQLLKLPGGADRSEIMEVLDVQLIQAGEAIHRRRTQLIERLAPLVAEYYRELSDDREQIELSYKSELNDAMFAEVLARAEEKDRIMQFTTSGIHRDDMRMKIGGYQLRKYGSQGQQKSFLVALKLAQYAVVAEEKGEKPILLLDDLFDKLDEGRVEKLLELVSGDAFGQIFITDCNGPRLKGILDRGGEPYTLFSVEGGNVSAL